MTKTKNTNEELPETIFLHVFQLKELNELAIAKGYNRSIYYEELCKDIASSWDREVKDSPEDRALYQGDTELALIWLQPVLVHNHAKGLEVEPHYRCLVGHGFLMLDVAIEDYEDYMKMSRYLKSSLGIDKLDRSLLARLDNNPQSWAV